MQSDYIMIAPRRNLNRKGPQRWNWFSIPIRFEDCQSDTLLFCKPTGWWIWWLKRVKNCKAEDIVPRAKTEKSFISKLGGIPATARVSLVQTAKCRSDVRILGEIKASDNILARNYESGNWVRIEFGNCREGDSILKREKVTPHWECSSFAECEYSDYVARPDWFRICKVSGVLLLVVAILGCLASCYWLNCKEATVKTVNKQPERIVEMKAPARSTIPVVSKEPVFEKASLGYENGIEILSLSTRTNSSGAVIEKLKLADGTSKTKIHPKPPLFKNPCDQVIAMAISTNPGDSMPPLPDLAGIDQDFANSLLTPIVINEDDSDEVKNIKEMVKEVRKTLVEEVKNGRSVMDVLMEHQKEMNRLYERRLDAILMMQKVCSEDGVEAAQKFADIVNVEFEKDGIPAIPVIGRGRNQQRNNRR